MFYQCRKLVNTELVHPSLWVRFIKIQWKKEKCFKVTVYKRIMCSPFTEPKTGFGDLKVMYIF